MNAWFVRIPRSSWMGRRKNQTRRGKAPCWPNAGTSPGFGPLCLLQTVESTARQPTGCPSDWRDARQTSGWLPHVGCGSSSFTLERRLLFP